MTNPLTGRNLTDYSPAALALVSYAMLSTLLAGMYQAGELGEEALTMFEHDAERVISTHANPLARDEAQALLHATRRMIRSPRLGSA